MGLGPDGGASKPKRTTTVKGRSTGSRAGAPVYNAWTPEKTVARSVIQNKGDVLRANRALPAGDPNKVAEIDPTGRSNAAFYGQANQNVNRFLTGAAAAPPPAGPGGPGGGGRGGYGGGGGGATPINADYLARMLAGQNWTAGPMTGVRDSINALRDNILTASQQDQAAATGAYNNLDAWLAANQRNPYEGVQLQNARVSNAGNPYLTSQGLQGINEVGQNPEDVGARNAFQNVLSLLGAGQQSANQSRLAESQMGRTYAGQQIGAMDNAYLANIDTRLSDVAAKEYEAQRQLDTEKRQAVMQLAAMLGQGATASPELLAQLGLA